MGHRREHKPADGLDGGDKVLLYVGVSSVFHDRVARISPATTFTIRMEHAGVEGPACASRSCDLVVAAGANQLAATAVTEVRREPQRSA
jgi:hypothetical protein